MFAEAITKAEIRELPLLRFEGKIHVIDSPKDVTQAIRALSKSSVIGFDTEKKPTFVKGQYHPTALLQLSTLTEAYLFRLLATGFHPEIKKILESESHLKIGISIRDDIAELKKVQKFNPGGFIDLNDISTEVGIQQDGVRNLTGLILESRISKGQQTSNWENHHLSKPQQSYAATDAWVCAKIYDTLDKKGYLL